MDESPVEPIERQLSIVVKLMARLLLTLTLDPGAAQKDQVRVFNTAGLQAEEIADILGTSGGSVRKALSRLRKEAQ